MKTFKPFNMFPNAATIKPFKLKYIPFTENLGRAEFTFCPVFKRGRLVEFYIDPLQQEITEAYKISFPTAASKIIHIYIDSYVEDTHRHWMSGWCEEHKTMFLRYYVPRDSNLLEITPAFGDTLRISFLNLPLGDE